MPQQRDVVISSVAPGEGTGGDELDVLLSASFFPEVVGTGTAPKESQPIAQGVERAEGISGSSPR